MILQKGRWEKIIGVYRKEGWRNSVRRKLGGIFGDIAGWMVGGIL